VFSYILFDLDGTLTDPKPGITACVQYALHSMGIEEPDLDKLEPFIGPPLRDSFREFYGMDTEQAEEAVVKYRERFSEKGLYENTLYPDMEQLLKVLKISGCHLAVASSKTGYFVEKILAYFDIDGYFDVVVGSEPDGSRSKKEEVVEEVLRRYFPDGSIPYDDIVMVGDRKFDITGGRENGIHQVGVTYGYAAAGELEAAGAEYVVNDLEELGKVLLLREK
jgi:phosphoglycolate phosphatase